MWPFGPEGSSKKSCSSSSEVSSGLASPETSASSTFRRRFRGTMRSMEILAGSACPILFAKSRTPFNASSSSGVVTPGSLSGSKSSSSRVIISSDGSQYRMLSPTRLRTSS